MVSRRWNKLMQLMVRLSACTGDAVVMVTLSLHILATRRTGISLQNREAKSSVTLMHTWHVITFDWHVETPGGTFRFLCRNLTDVVLNKVTGGKAWSAAAVSLWTDCVESCMICKALWHTATIINSTAVTTLNVSSSTRSAANWLCVRLQRNVSFHWSTNISQTTGFISALFSSLIIFGRLKVRALISLGWWKSPMKLQTEWTDWRLYMKRQRICFFVFFLKISLTISWRLHCLSRQQHCRDLWALRHEPKLFRFRQKIALAPHT